VLQVASSGVSLLLQATHFALVARLTTPRQFGAYVAALALYGIAGAIGEFGLIQTTVLMCARYPEAQGRVLRRGLAASLSLGLIALLMGGVFAVAFLPRPVWTAAAALVPAFLVMRVQLPVTAYAQARLALPRLALSETAGRLLAVLVMLWALAHAGDLTFAARMGAAGGSMAAGLLLTLVLRAERWPPSVTDGAPSVRDVLRVAMPIGLTTAASYIHVRVDQIVIGAFGIVIGLAAYGVAYRVVDSAIALVNAIGVLGFATLASAPAASRLAVAKRFSALMTSAAVVLGTLSFAMAPLLVRVVGGGEYPDAAWFARLLGLALVLPVLNLVPGQVAIVEGRASALFRVALLGVAVNVALNLVLVPTHGIRGAIAATIVSETLGLFLVARIASAVLPDVIDVASAALAVLGFLGATFGALAMWREVSPAAGLAVAAVGVLVGLARPAWALGLAARQT
jgi:O-antigen/teichoic acid export membrane protein